MTTTLDRERRGILRNFGASGSEQDELLAYNASRFSPVLSREPFALPLTDEPFVAAWEERIAAARETSTWTELRRWMPQLAFPVERGVSGTVAYRCATQSGVSGKSHDSWMPLRMPELLHVELLCTAAGRLPVIRTSCRADFVYLVQALTHRNEPVPIPPSMGACAVSGHMNWQSVAQRAAVADSFAWRSPAPHRPHVTGRELRAAVRDRFILATDGPYSGVSAESLSLDQKSWQRDSRTIRTEHECAHYLMRRCCGAMSNALLDELLADYYGIVAARGAYRHDWFLAFMGAGDARDASVGGRISNYRGTPPLSDGAFTVVTNLLRRASRTVHEFDEMLQPQRDAVDRSVALLALTSFTLETLCIEGAATEVLSQMRLISGHLAGAARH
jgi:hypothetical protein